MRILRTLRGRITIGLVSVLLVACAIVGVATVLFLRGFLIGRLDDQLAAAGGRYSASLEQDRLANDGTDADSDRAVPGQAVGTLGVRLTGGQVTDAAVVGSSRALVLSDEDRRKLRAVRPGAGPSVIDLEGLDHYRVRAVLGRDGDVQITGLPLEPVDETVGHVVLVELGLFAVVVIASGMLTAFGVSRSLRPLRRVADTAMEVSTLPLTDRGTLLPSSIAPANPSSEADQVSVAFDHMLTHVRTALAARDHTEAGLRRFVADASHELRTPLATIRAYAEYAGRADADADSQGVALARIDVAAARMTALVDDLLLLARLDAGRPLAQDEVDITRLVVEAVDDARAAGPDHHWRLDLPEDVVMVIGDVQRLHQVLANLLTNARVHTPDGTTVVTTVAYRMDSVCVEVCDDGPGIASDLTDGLFDRFTRGDSARTRDTGSTGLGLAIAYGIVAAHAGTLEFTGRPGENRFTVLLPRSAE
ncbi:MAG: HAMP domain-containing sensor histidine kinase [Jatrophihabitans sp.]